MKRTAITERAERKLPTLFIFTPVMKQRRYIIAEIMLKIKFRSLLLCFLL